MWIHRSNLVQTLVPAWKRIRDSVNKMEKVNKQKKIVKNYTLEHPIPIDLSREITRMFNINKNKDQRISEYMCDTIRKTKLKALKSKLEMFEPVPNRPSTSKDFRKFAEKCSISDMSRFLERDIKRKIQARGLEGKYPLLLADIFKETKLEYKKIIHYAGMNCKIKHCYPDAVFTVEPYKFVGKTELYANYLLVKNRLELKWILHYPVIRKILKECVTNLPYELFELKFQKALTLPEIESILKDKAQFASQYVYEFYIKIVQIVQREQKKGHRIYKTSYLEASSGLLSVHVSRSIAHTMLHVVRRTSFKETRPYLILNIYFEKGLVLEPQAEDVIEIFHKFLEKIIDVGQEVCVLQGNASGRDKRTPIHLCLTEEFIVQCKDDIRQNINQLYEPIIKYLDEINGRFQEVYKDIDSKDFFQSISDIVFEDGCKKINYYQEYLHKVMFVPDHEFFNIGKIFLIEYREHIHEELNKNIIRIFDKLCSQHLWEVTDLCETFDLIRLRATQKPVTTEELVETGKYMNWIRTEHLMELNTRVHSSLSSLCQIIELGFLSEDHMRLNATAIHWLDDILPIIEEHSTNFEQLKFDAEDKLQKVVEDVTVLIKDMYPLLVILDEMDNIANVRSYLNDITLHMMKIKDIETQIAWINKEEVCLSFPKSTYTEYEDLKNYVHPFYHLLKLCLEVNRNLSVWQDGPFESLDHERTKNSVDKFHSELTELYKIYRKKLRQAQDENLPLRFKGTVDDPDILNWPAPLKLCGTALRLIEDFRPSVDVMMIICNPSLRKRHWAAISEIAGENVTPNAGTTLRKIMQVDFKSNLEEYEIISTGATKEKQLVDHLRELNYQWNQIEFNITLNDRVGLKTLSQLEDIESVLNDHTIKLLNMRSSVFVKPHEDQVKQFYNNIIKIRHTVNCWDKMQIQMVKLLPVFSKSDLSNVIPNGTEMFKHASDTYTKYITIIEKKLKIFEIVVSTDITREIDLCLDHLEVVYDAVVRYLETVRRNFPRFHFLSNDELLEVISNTKHAFDSQTFLVKIFQEIHSLAVTDGTIIGVLSRQSDKLKFRDAIRTDVSLEKICSHLEKQMQLNLMEQMSDCYKLFKRMDLRSVLRKFSEQIILIMSQIYWREDIESALKLTHNIKLRICYQKLKNSIAEKITLVNDADLTCIDRLKLRNIIVDDINKRTLLETVLEKNCVNENQFDWESSIKYYYKDQICMVQMMYSKIPYRYEYQGSPVSLISTPVTDRCLRTLINAYNLRLSGLIRGTSGAGKSEIIRGLARAFGIFFVTFTCPDQAESPTFEGILRGNALCGTWLCLENVSALSGGVLSVLSQGLLAIADAVKTGTNKCHLANREIEVNPTSFVCASLFSESIHTDLPRNMKVLFRTITVVSPDLTKIAETMLYSYGFASASALSKKLVCVFDDGKNIFISKSHYTFDMNHLKQVVLECCKLRSSSEYDDELILYKAIKQIFWPQMKECDFNFFEEILQSVFPAIFQSEETTNNIFEIVADKCKRNNLQLNDKFAKKIMETYESIKTRSCIIMVGDTYSGKTTALNLCKELLADMQHQTIEHHYINPNYLDHNDLYGDMDRSTQRWSDGVITKFFRKFSFDLDTKRKWLVFDGSINDTWIESMTPILRDSKIFYLKSGERLVLPESYSTIFEVKDLKHCSPSIVSRCAIIYMEVTNIGWSSLLRSWINTCESEWMEGHEDQLLDILNWLIPPCLTFIAQSCKQLIYPSEFDLVKTCINIIQTTLDEVFTSGINKEEEIKNMPAWIQGTLVQGCIFGLGSTLDSHSRHKFDEFCKVLWKGHDAQHPYPKSLEKLEVSLPHEGIIFDYQFIYKQRGIWKLYQDLLKAEKIVESPYMYEIPIPTIESLRSSYIFNIFIKYKKPVLFVGPASTGKTFFIEDTLINKLNKKYYESCHLNFNLHYSPEQVQTFILSKLNKSKTGLYSPQVNKSLLVFIDNLNLSTSDSFGTIKCLELLRQLLAHEVWYDFTSCEKLSLENIIFFTTVGLYSDTHKQICKRFLRHFHTFSLNEFSDDTITRIYSSSLFYQWKKSGHASDTIHIANNIAEGTLKVYKEIMKQCKPTINRCYYVFNLNNFSKVIQVCSILKKETHDANKKIYVKLWVHEMLRVFGDRLTSLEFSWLQANIKIIVTDTFNENYDEIFDCPSTDKMKHIMFGTLNDCENKPICRKYEEISDRKHLVDVVSEFLVSYNYHHEIKLDVIFFTYALEKLIQLCRILSLTFGNSLLLGISGSGRKSLTKLGSFIYKQKLFQPVITQSYTIDDWTAEIKTVLKETGAKDKQCVLLVTEEQLISEDYLDIVHQLLQKGEIPNLFNMDEKQEILELARLSAQGGNRNVDISSSAVFLYFNKRCKENLHLMLCLNPNKIVFRERIWKYPSLMDCHVIYWNDWPDESFQCISNTWIGNLSIETCTKVNFTKTAVYFHRDFQRIAKQMNGTNHNGITTTRFIHLVKLFKELSMRKHSEIHLKKQRYLQALSKLSFAANQISNMQKALAEYQPQLEEMTQKAIQMTEQIALETIEVEKASALVRKDEKIASEQAIVAQQLKSECESELAQAIPILEDAISALNTLKPSDITLVKSMKNPPDAIKLVMAAVCVIKDVKPDRIPDPSTGRKTIDYWGPSKRILGDMNFLQTLKDFDKDHIKPEIMVKIRKEYLPHKDFKPHVVAKASSAAEGLCKWIIAMDMYDKVAKEVAPKKEKLVKAEREYAATMAILNQKKEEVKRIEQKLADLKAMLEDATHKQMKLRREVDFCNRKLMSAQKLIGSLSGEKIRWTVSVKNLENQENLVPGNILLSCSIICYLSSFDWNVRNEISAQWHRYISESDLLCSTNFNIIKSLASVKDTDHWLKNGLPNDNYFFENVIIFKFSRLFSVIVDPEYQAVDWIQRTEKYNSLTTTTFLYDDFLRKLEQCITFGKPIIIQKIKEHIPAAVNDLMSKRIFENNNAEFIRLNNKIIKYNRDFRLYLVSNLQSPEFSPENTDKMVLINFSISTKGLEEKLLKIVTEIEKPELRKMKKELLYRRGKTIAEISTLEEKILRTLCESDADILEDEASIKILDQSKDLARIAREEQNKSRTIEQTIEQFTSKYNGLSSYCANVYLSIVKLKHINKIYQFSMEWFTDLYSRSILNAARSRHFDTKCLNIMNFFTYQLFRNVEYSLFDDDRIVFLFLLSTGRLLFKKEMTEQEYLHFIDTEINKISKLSSLEGFDKVTHSFENDAKSWSSYFHKGSNIFKKYPPLDISNFQILILVKILKPTMLRRCIRDFIAITLGVDFLHYIPYSIKVTFDTSYSLSPILFFSLPGCNSFEAIKHLAGKNQILHKFQHLSFGDKCTDIADQYLNQAQKEGAWLLLQNCHLVPQWFNKLEKRLIDMDYDNTHENFRLWLTSEPSSAIPVELLQTCIKVIDDVPEGIARNMERYYKKEPISNSDFYNNCPGKHDIFTKLLYGLTFFHCILQERRKFNKMGWNASYFFDESDLNISLQQLVLILNENFFSLENSDKIMFLIGHCNYANYLNNDWDRDLLICTLSDCLNPNIIRSNYRFNNINEYSLPKKCDYNNYLDLISKLPLDDRKEIYGLNYLSSTFLNLKKSDSLLQTALKITGYRNGKVLNENEFSLITSIEYMLQRVPSQIDNKLETNYVIVREISLYNTLLDIIRNTLVWLRHAISGTVIMSSNYEDMAADLLNNRVPKLWQKYGYSNEADLSQFLVTLSAKIEFIKNLSDKDKVFWLGAFIYPKSLLCKLKIDSAKQHDIPRENFSFTHEILDEVSPLDEEGIFVRDLYLFGAQWDRVNRTLCEATSSLYDKFPPIKFKPYSVNDSESRLVYNCPLYQNCDFSDYIDSVEIESETKNHWFKRGVRLLCEINKEFDIKMDDFVK